MIWFLLGSATLYLLIRFSAWAARQHEPLFTEVKKHIQRTGRTP